MAGRVAQEDVKRTVNTILTGPSYDNVPKSSPGCQPWAQECEPSNENGSTVERLANYASVGDVNGSRAYCSDPRKSSHEGAYLTLSPEVERTQIVE